jgi:hypothetical protein
VANSVDVIKEALVSRFDLRPSKIENSHLHSSSVWLHKTSTFRLRFIILTLHQTVHLPIMTKAKNIAAKRKHADDEGSSDVPYDTEWSATPTEDTNTGLPFFRDTRANINSIVAHPETFHWVREFGDRDVLCWEKADKNSRKDIQLITIGEIKTADLEVPNNSSSFGSQGDLETSMIETKK